MDLTFRFAPCAKGAELAIADLVEDRLGQDRARGIAGAEEQNVEVFGHVDFPALDAADRAAASFAFGRWFCSADEGAEEFAVYLRRDCVHVESLAGEECAGVFDAIDARGFDLGFRKSGVRQFAEIIVFFESARDASNPQENAFANFGKHFAARHNVRNSEAATGFKHAKSFAENSVFVGRQIDYAI